MRTSYHNFILSISVSLSILLSFVSCRAGSRGDFIIDNPHPAIIIYNVTYDKDAEPPVTVEVEAEVYRAEEGSLFINWGDTKSWFAIPLPDGGYGRSRLYHTYTETGDFIVTVQGKRRSEEYVHSESAIVYIGR